MNDDPVRVLIVDDSALMRRALRSILERDPHILVVGEAANGREALAQVAALRPNVITMDVRMPVMDGLETTEQLMAYYPTPILVITASLSSYDIDITFQMLGAGALDVMEKPRLSDQAALDKHGVELIRRVKAVARMRVVTHLRGRRRGDTVEVPGRAQRASPPAPAAAPATLALVPPATHVVRPVPHAPPRPVPQDPLLKQKKAVRRHQTGMLAHPLLVIGASAGGPRVVHQILASLPLPFHAAVVVVQHIAEGFGAGMAEWLSGAGTLMVRLAQEGMPLEVGTALVVPDGRDLVIEKDGRIHLDSEPLRIQRPRPSVDITMESAAQVFGRHTIGVLLTGMGRDGALGMQAIHEAGGYTIAQNEASAPIYGMPRAAVELGVVDDVLAPEDMVAAIQRHIIRG
jgi:two-component system chemotaxis response regulator CheB